MSKTGTLTVKVVGDAKNFEDTLGGLGRKAGVAFAAVGAAAVAGAGASLHAFIGFERQMNEVFTLLPGISGDAMRDMSNQVKDFSREFAVLPTEVVPALYQSLSAGVPPDNVFEFLEVAQKAAVGGVTDLATAVDGISSVVNAYGSDVLSAAEASDLMFTAVRLGKTDFQQLSSSIFNVAPIASAVGVEFSNVTAALANLTAQGTPTSVAATQIRSALSELAREGTKADVAFRDAAGIGFQDFINQGGDLGEAFQMIARHADESGKSVLDMFGSVEAGQAVLGLSGANADAFRATLEEMGNSAGATGQAYEQMMTGLGPVIDRIKANVAVFMIEVGEKLAPLVMTALDKLGEAFGRLKEWWDENGPQIIERVRELRDMFLRFVDRVKGAIEAVKEAWEEDGLWGALQELGNQIENAWSEIVWPALKELGSKIRGWFANLWTDYIKPGITTAWDGFVEWLLSGGPQRLADNMTQMITALTEWITEEGIPAGIERLTTMVDAFGLWFTEGEGFKKIARVGFMISAGIVAGIAMISLLVGKVALTLLGALLKVGDMLYQELLKLGLRFGLWIAEGIADGIRGAKSAIQQAVFDAIPGGGTARNLGRIATSAPTPLKPLGFLFNARGTRNFAGGWSVVGEEGPELVRLPTGSDVYSHLDSRNMIGGGGGSSVVNHFQFDVYVPPTADEAAVGASVARVLREYARSGGDVRFA